MIARDYIPPTFRIRGTSLNDRVRDFLAFWQQYADYNKQFMKRLFLDDQPFVSIVAAGSISPTGQVQQVTGGTTISTIDARPDMSPITLLAIDGFSTNTAGNISAVVTLAAGTGRNFVWNPGTEKWFPS